MIGGIDMGGTHIDGAIIDDGKIVKTIKKATDRNDLFNTIWTTLKELLEGVDKEKISRINLSTTVSTNAIVENKISKVGMIVQSGPGRNYDFFQCTKDVEFTKGYVDHRGEVVDDLDNNNLEEIKANFKKNNIEAVGIVTKFSTRNPSHEKLIFEKFKDDFNDVTMGHSLSGKLNFPRRVETTYLNAAVNKTFKDFANNIKKALEQEQIIAPVYILKADGGTMSIDSATEKPVETILSGPAASFMGLSALFEEEKDGILLDIGGTTTDIFFLVDGVQLFEPLGISIDDHKTLIRAIYSTSIGLGGDSLVYIENGQILIGPKRAGDPIAFGGSELTPTDAMVALGKLKGEDSEQAIRAIKEFGKLLDLSIEDVSTKILEKFVSTIYKKIEKLLIEINSHPVYTIKELLSDYKIEPTFINVIGGPAKILAPLIEDKFKLRVKYPKKYKVANAVGAALAIPTIEINMHADTDRGILSVPEVKIYEEINRGYNLDKAKKRALEIIEENSFNATVNLDDGVAEIVEANSYNMVKGFLGASKNIRVRAQTKPGLIYKLKDED